MLCWPEVCALQQVQQDLPHLQTWAKQPSKAQVSLGEGKLINLQAWSIPRMKRGTCTKLSTAFQEYMQDVVWGFFSVSSFCPIC